MIPLARVEFIESVQAPGPDLCIFPRVESVFVNVACEGERFQRSSSLDPKAKPKAIQRYELWLDGDFVLVKHPDGEQFERFHVSRCRQLTELPKRLHAKGKAA
jgi:hypothetical protein